MKARANLILLAGCTLMFVLGFYFIQSLSEQAARTVPTTAADRAHFKNPRTKAAQPFTAAAQIKTVYVTNQFHWSQLESTDYREYIANLRKVGCPEATIKDIIITDFMRLYAARRGQFYQNSHEFHFWETNEKRKPNARQLEEREKQLAKIDKEIPKVMRELLGVNYEREIDKYFVDANEDEQRLNFVSGDKRDRLLALREEMETLRERLEDDLANGKISPEKQRAALRKLEQERTEKLGKILSPAELEEFELRTSETAEALREALIGFSPTEEEFRKLYLLQKASNEKSAGAANDELAQAELQKMKEEIRRQLGDERYADYDRAANADYRNACLFSQLYELPAATAQTIFEIKRIAEQEKLNLLANQAIPADRRSEALEAIRKETENNLLEVLGTKLLSNYTQSSGSWVQQLGSEK